MVKGQGKGGKNRRRGKNEADEEKRELTFKEEGQEYGQVLKLLGNSRISTMCFDGVLRTGHIRGKIRKKVWIVVNDIILLSLRDFQDDQADIILKYSPEEARNLKAYGELPETANLVDDEAQDPAADFIEFEDGEDDELNVDDI